MEYRKVDKGIVVRIDKNEKIIETLKHVCETENIRLASVNGIGALSKAELAHFNSETKVYSSNVFNGMYEVASLTGNISQMDGTVYLHIHAVLADHKFVTYGGHFVEGTVGATAEVLLHIYDDSVDRTFNEEIGLNLMDFKK